jgi:hypothetical protein
MRLFRPVGTPAPALFSRWALASYCPFCSGSRPALASAAHGLEPPGDPEPDKCAGFSFYMPSQNVRKSPFPWNFSPPWQSHL